MTRNVYQPGITAEEVLVALGEIGHDATAARANEMSRRMDHVRLPPDARRADAIRHEVRTWIDLEQRNTALRAIIRPMPRAKWQADVSFNSIERQLATFHGDYGLNLVPDYQRGHVWTQSQQERFVEAVMRGSLASGQLVIQFNAPHFEDYSYKGDLPREIQCIDGLQRLTAVQRFMAGEIRAFDRIVDDFVGTEYDPKRTIFGLKFAIHTFLTRAELLQFYLDLNSGGTPHSSAELDRVAGLLAAAREGSVVPGGSVRAPGQIGVAPASREPGASALEI
ncbi:hypothetical protein R70006_06329 [Paraburkholderia domus]|uniref:DUF262 domain-containing protein n=1 Tax=Paraburkholderia domus TaxID=2793075 RepID=UPI0019121FF2|nr:DUF262 domain-containing protein [Paraburkholderia domus]MBK5052954.1 DUF262 domain-containing protein [Burkholderia sp. R-70006]CAE6823668.1 hypothetical protein R70006_06329 [Paraburkholderia domus]